ncbi:hypothetical protein BAE44_0006994 [Dichanthelium oligosanthes]|uniref:Uncharacterized protein n=1 Tax=Dichanthelium oligosanthes TaxID=888268 RepID=A0A1E5W3Y6_9POAL|nr:hypothetical protein BAE44_0006994 [Dichanthelium oligosanthes]
MIYVRTPRAQQQQQLVQDMPSEGSLVFPVPENMVVAMDSNAGNSAGVGAGLELNPVTDQLHLRERPDEAFGLNSMGPPAVDREPLQPDVGASEAALLELFPVQQEQMGSAVEASSSMEIDLELSLAVQPSCNLELQL